MWRCRTGWMRRTVPVRLLLLCVIYSTPRTLLLCCFSSLLSIAGPNDACTRAMRGANAWLVRTRDGVRCYQSSRKPSCSGGS